MSLYTIHFIIFKRPEGPDVLVIFHFTFFSTFNNFTFITFQDFPQVWQPGVIDRSRKSFYCFDVVGENVRCQGNSSNISCWISILDPCLFAGKALSIYNCPYAPVCGFQLTKKEMRDPARVPNHLRNQHQVKHLGGAWGVFVCLYICLFIYLCLTDGFSISLLSLVKSTIWC